MQHLVIGSTRANSGKSATVLGLGLHLQARGFTVGYGKPLGTFATLSLPEESDGQEADVEFITRALNLPPSACRPTLCLLDRQTLAARLQGIDTTDYRAQLAAYTQMTTEDVVLVEGPANTAEGAIFGLTLQAIAEALSARILLVVRYGSLLAADHVIVAKERLGDRPVGVLLNDIPHKEMETVKSALVPYLEQQGIPVLGLMPESRILRSVSVAALVEKLGAEVMYAPDRLSLNDITIEELKIGAMDANSAQFFFRTAHNKAVVTSGARVDIQLAALSTSTNCLVLTGQTTLHPEVQQRAADLEVPILAVKIDTLSAVKIIENCLGGVRLHEGSKVRYVRELMTNHVDFDRLLQLLNL